MSAIILNERAATLSVTKIYKERLEKSAELVAKKELVSLSTAIDSAATRGQDSVDFKLSASITRLTDNYHDIAITTIEDDIRAAGYDALRELDKNGVIIGYQISWAEQEEEEEEETPATPDEPAEPEENQEDPTPNE